MKIIDVIGGAATEYEIRFLLTAYVESACYCGRLNDGAGDVRKLPVGGIGDVQARTEALEAELAHPSWAMRAADRAVVQEATAIFRMALQRLQSLDAEKRLQVRTKRAAMATAA